MCVDKVVIRKSGEELCSKTHQSPSAPQRIVLRPHYGRQDTTSSDARTSLDHSSQHKENCDGGTYKETYRGEIDFRIQALPHSVVQEYDHIRKEAVQKLSHQFETHPNKEALQRDLKQNRAFNPFSEQTKEMMYSMGNMEYFEIFEITPNIQCPNCVTRWPKVIVFCTRGRCLRPPDKVRKLNSDRFDVLSIPNYVIKKSPFHGARHGNTERETENPPCSPCLFYKGGEEGFHINAGQILEMPYLSTITSGHRHAWIRLPPRIILTSAAERPRREITWVLVLNSSGPNGPMIKDKIIRRP